MKRAKPIEGFKVMDWLRDVRKKGYELYKKDPLEYHRQIRIGGERFRKRITEASKDLS